MNRKIVFRAKEVSTNNWVFGDLIQYENGDTAIFDKKMTEYGCEATQICRRTKVVPDTIGQFTGLLDRNQNPIYEGDILGANGKVIGWIEGSVRGYCYDVVYINHPKGEKRWSLYGTVKHDFPNKIEVIGNVFDNKDLLEE